MNDVFYDIGANVGTYTCFAASKLDNRNVIAFEPEPNNVKKLRKNLEINNVDAKILEVALSDTNGTIDFALTGDEAGEGEHAIATDSDSKSIEVQTARGNSIIEERGLPMPTVVKIDVEGAELSVLRGMEHVLQKSCRLVYVEVHPDKLENFNSKPSEVESILEDAGFTINKLTQRRSEYFIKGKKK
ncbi:FkbM family methyltransferase [Halobacterium noricense]|nr:FkbM family methyltransferase [Halobacterium noricense]